MHTNSTTTCVPTPPSRAAADAVTHVRSASTVADLGRMRTLMISIVATPVTMPPTREHATTSGSAGGRQLRISSTGRRALH